MKRGWKRPTCFWILREGLRHRVILPLSTYNLPLSVFLLFRWWWRSRLAAWVLRFSASGDCLKACGTVIFLLSVYNLPLSVFLLFLWRWRSRFAAWVLLFFGLQGAIEDENINTGFLGLLLVLVPILWVSILCLSQFFLSFPASPSLCFAFFSPPWGRLCSAFIEPATASVVVTVAHHPKCSVTAVFNEENVCVSC